MRLLEEPEHSLGYPESQARRIVGTGLWNDFLEWMKGQTVGLTEAGKTIYYVSDVSRYLTLRRTGRKEHPEEWD